MCIFIGPVKNVSKTRILVMPLENNRQVIVYENNVESISAKNAMVLPVPVNGLEMPSLLDLSKTSERLWTECENYFPQHDFAYAGGGFGIEEGSWSSKTLPVHRVGGYNCSIVPTLDDFVRISTEHFHLPVHIRKLMEQHYARGFAFVVCTFDRMVKAHAIGIVSQRLANGHCFIPTMHAHGEDAQPVLELMAATHQHIRCDACQMNPITGTRWKCTTCTDYDMCDPCFRNKKQSHNHVFLCYERPRESYSNGPLRDSNMGDFDHTIYIANAIFMAGYRDITEQTTSTTCRQKSGTLTGLQNVMGKVRVNDMMRVTIKGDFPNRDYQAVVLQ